MTEKQITWEEATSIGKFVKFETGVRKEILVKNPQLKKVLKTFKGEEREFIELSADVIEEDGVECDKVLTTISKRLMGELRLHLEGLKSGSIVRLSVKKIGKDTDTNYDVERREI